MTDRDSSGRSPLWRRLLARRWHRVLLVVLVLAILVRAALPTIVRRVVVDQADAALVGRIEIDDVDLALLTGGFTLHGLRVFAAEAAPAGEPPVVSPAATSTAADSPPPSAVPLPLESAAASPSPPGVTPPAAEAFAASPSPSAVPSPLASAAATSPRPSPMPSAVASPRAAGEGPPGSAPVVSVARLSVDIGLLALWRRLVEVQRLELEGVAVSVDRARGGALVLPEVVAAETPEPEPSPQGPGWGVLVQSVMLRDGRIGFRDFAVGDPPQHVEVALPTLDAQQLALLITERGLEPGKVTLDAAIQDGTLRFEATLENLAGGTAYQSHVVLSNVPIGKSRLYIPRVGWSDLAGRLDADLVHRFESDGAHGLRGTVDLRELRVRVDGLDRPALAWKALGIDIGNVDLVAQHADVTGITLAGARLAARPGDPVPLPVLEGLLVAAAEGDAAPAAVRPTAVATADVEPTPGPTAPPADATPAAPAAAVSAPSLAPSASASPPGTPPASAPIPAPPAAVRIEAGGGKPWTWTIGKVTVADAELHAVGGDGPLDLGIAADVARLASAPATASTVRLTLTPSSGGSVELAGDLTVTPLGFAGTLVTKDLVLPPLTQPVATAATRLLKSGVLSCTLDVAVGATPQAPPDGLRVAGTIGLIDLDVAGEDPDAFALRWKDLAVVVDAVTAPGLLAPAADGAAAPLVVALANITLARPEIVVTRTAEGIVLPAAMSEEAPPPDAVVDAAVAAPAAPAAPPPAAPASAAPAAEVRVGRLAIAGLRVAATDTTVAPTYRSTLDPVSLEASELRWPGPAAKDLKLVAKSAEGAVFTLTGSIAAARSRLVAKLTGLPLAPFDPYASGTGYGLGGGTARLESTIEIGPRGYDTTNRLVLNELDVRTAEGDALFKDRFGVPLALALSLMTDLRGNIVLNVPIRGDEAGMRTDLGAVIGDALARAILNAVTSPLKLIGAVARIGDKPQSLTPPPVEFLAGRATRAADAADGIEGLTKLLAAAPELRLRLRGEAGEADRRWLREQALRAELADESGFFSTLRHLGENEERDAVLEALTARAEGGSGEIPAEHRDWFEAQVAAQSVPDAALRELAAARAAAIEKELASATGVEAARVAVDEPTAIGGDGRSVVTIGLAASTAVTPQAPRGQSRRPE